MECNRKQIYSWEISALQRALIKTQLLLEEARLAADYEQIHNTKSSLYAAIEQVGLKVERLVTLQRMLRELFAIVNTYCVLPEHERRVGNAIILEVKERYEEIMNYKTKQNEKKVAP